MHTAKKLKQTITIIALSLMMICAGIPFSQVHAASNFIIEDYNVDITVGEDDVYQITETIKVHFTSSSHGIYRTIPYNVTLDRDGQKSTFVAGIDDFKMLSGHKYKKESGPGFNIRIGDPDKYEAEDTVYKLSYRYDMKGDHLKDADEMYYNIVGTSWEAKSIDHVSFKVTFPKAIDPSKVGIKTAKGARVPFECTDDLVITGETSEDTLGGLTIRAVLPEGYFTKQEGASNILFYIMTLIMALIAGAGVLIWRKHGRDPKIIETEEFYPPKGLNPAEVAYLEKQSLSGNDVVSMLLLLADRGYLKISEKETTKGLRKKTVKTYEITQLKEYDGDGAGEAKFIEGLFLGGGRSVVTMDDLQNSFYKTVGEVEDEITEKYEGMMYDEKAGKYAKILKGAGICSLLLFMILSKFLNGSPWLLDGEIILSIVMYSFAIALLIGGFIGLSAKINATKKGIFGFIGWPAAIIAGLALSYLLQVMVGVQVIPFLIGIVLCFVLMIIGQLCERKTDEYIDLLGKIRGFKRFLKVAEKDRIEMLAEQDPSYYYRTLAFAFAMGITAVYARNFASLATRPPQWYDGGSYYHSSSGDGVFDTTALTDAVSNMMTSMSSSMTSSPSSDSGGGSFSGGGGAGGGGGGSW